VKTDLDHRSALGEINNSVRLAKRACPLCGGLERKLLSIRETWEIVECIRCDMVFIGDEFTYATQIQDHDWLEDYPKEMQRRKQKHPVLLFCSRLVRHLRPKTNDRLLAQTLRWKRGGQLVDFGCGDASFIERASDVFGAVGIEISPRLAALSRLRMPAAKILEGPVTKLAEEALDPDTFDVVTQFGYIEHEWQPLAALRAARRVLKPGGITIIKTPNYASWNRHVMGMDWCGYHIPAHCNYFTPRTLGRMLKKAGFDPLPRPLLDCLPTSDSLWMAAQKSGHSNAGS
jgi:SAM-dependent methyltransferase